MRWCLAAARHAARTTSSSSARTLLAARWTSRSSRPDISGVNSISAPPSAALATASARTRAFASGSMPLLDWKSAIRVIGSGGDQLVELAGALERDELVAAPDMLALDEDLRHRRSPSRALDHRLFLRPAEIDHDLLIRHAFGFEQVFGAPAIRTKGL